MLKKELEECLSGTKTLAFDEKAQYVRGICRQEDQNQVLVDKVTQYDKQSQDLLLTTRAEKLVERRTFDQTNGLKPGAEPP